MERIALSPWQLRIARLVAAGGYVELKNCWVFDQDGTRVAIVSEQTLQVLYKNGYVQAVNDRVVLSEYGRKRIGPRRR